MWICSCATNPSPDATTPRAGDATYPILLTDDGGDIRDAALAAWANFARRQGITNPPAPDLRPVTATLRSLPAVPQTYLYLPKVGEGPTMSEGETRESLRRFVAEAGTLFCGDPQQLSFVAQVNGKDGINEAHYEQRPFRFALHGDYGKLNITFTTDRRVTGLTSTCIPNVERIRRGFVGLGQQRMTAEKATQSLVGLTVTYADDNGYLQTYLITEKDKLNARQLVIYPIERIGEQPALEFHVAWEISVDATKGMTVYLDSIMGDILSTEIENRP